MEIMLCDILGQALGYTQFLDQNYKQNIVYITFKTHKFVSTIAFNIINFFR